MKINSSNQWITLCTSLVTLTLGAFALFGEQINYFVAPQLQTTYLEMSYDTALCFCIASAAAISLIFKQRYVTKILAILIISIILSIVIGGTWNPNFNVVQKLFIPNLEPELIRKMRTVTTFSFFIIGCIFWAISSKKAPSSKIILFGGSIVILILSFAILSLFGYVIYLDKDHIDGLEILAPMSTNTSIGFVLLCIGMSSILADFRHHPEVQLQKSLPIIITVFLSLVSLIFWRLLILEEASGSVNPNLMIITLAKELGIALLFGVAIYFLQITRQHAKRAEHMFFLAKQAESQLLHQANHDALTGLPNRFSLLDHIEQAILHAKRQGNLVALLFIDLNGFKTINDSLGHAVGDLFLKTLTTRLLALTRKQDTLARLGGDEFVLLVLDVHDERGIITIVEKYLAVFSEPFHVENHELHLSCSIGISIYPQDGADPHALLKNSDIAMYKAKKNKQHFQFYTEQMQQQIIERLSIENELRRAIKEKEFIIYYQPVINLKRKEITALEALIRWKNPKKGFIGPDEFIPIAEETGMIVAIDSWTLHTICVQNKLWQEKNILKARININLSEKQIKLNNFYELIKTTLDKLSYDPSYLTLELTENILMDDVPSINMTFQQLKDLNIKLAVDDFGTKYSSLNRLRHLPIDSLKIDKSFLKHLPENSDDKAIVLAIISLAKNLELNVVAEGVETKEQLQFLHEHGCDEIQGYYFSEPLEANVLEASIGELNKKIQYLLKDF